MMKMIWIFLILLISGWIGVYLHRDPGYVLVAVHHWTVEATLWTTLLSLLVLFIITHTLLILWKKITHIPALWRKQRLERRARKAQAQTRQGLIEFSEGQWKLAQNDLIKALPDAETPLLNYLTAARAAQEMGDAEKRDHYLREAQRSMPDAHVAVVLTQAQLQLAHQQWEQALATLQHLHELTPHHPYVLKLLMQLYEDIKDWPQLIKLLPELKRHSILSDIEFSQLTQRAYFNALSVRMEHGSPQQLTDFFLSIPKKLQNDAQIMGAKARFLLSQNDFNAAEELLRRILRQDLHPDLLVLYAQLPSQAEYMRFAESLLKTHPNNAQLYLCLARMSFAATLWGKAKNYLEKSLELHPTAAAYAERAHLLELTQDYEGACRAYRKMLELKNIG